MEKTLEKSIILLSGSTYFVARRLKAGTTGPVDNEGKKLRPDEYIVIANETVSEADREQIKTSFPTTHEKEIGWRIQRRFNDTIGSSKTKLMLIYAGESDIVPILPKFKESMLGPYKDIATLTINVQNNRAKPEDETKPIREIFLVTFPKSEIMSKKFMTLAEALVLGAEKEKSPEPEKPEVAETEKPKGKKSEIVTGTNIKEIYKQLLKAANNPDLNIVVIDASELDETQKTVARSFGEAGDYEVQVIEIIPEEGDVPEPEKATPPVTITPASITPATVETLEDRINKIATELLLEKPDAMKFHDFAVEILATKLKMEKGTFQKRNNFIKELLIASVRNKLITTKDEIQLKTDFDIK